MDERFSWRMFSSTSMSQVNYDFYVKRKNDTEEKIVFDPRWEVVMKMGHQRVFRKALDYLCDHKTLHADRSRVDIAIYGPKGRERIELEKYCI